MHFNKESIIGEVVASDYRTATVFKHNGIDFCCKGDRSIEQACHRKNIEIEQILTELHEATNSNSTHIHDYSSWQLDFLADYIENHHHTYVRKRIEEIKPFLEKTALVHGSINPELIEIRDMFLASCEELTAHMAKEELILFTFIRKMVDAKKTHAAPPPPHFGSVENPIQMMKHEHATEGDRFRKIAELSNNYTPPSHACNTYRVVFSLLEEFERDLHMHIHLENNILFPKAIEMEHKLQAKLSN